MKIKRIKLKKLANTRDLGGYKTSDGKTVISKKLIRSGHLGNAPTVDIDTLVNEYNLKTVIDLRIDAEIKENPDNLPSCVEYIHFPLLDKEFLGIARDEYSIKSWFNLFKDSDRRPEDVFYDMYELLVFGERSSEYIPKIFDVLINNSEGSVLWHCSAGKDRVGIVTMLVLSALGVDKETVIEDFLATNRFCFAEIAKTRIFAPLVIHDRRLRKCLAILMGVKREYLEKIFDKIEREYDSFEEFLFKQYGIDSEKTDILKSKYLE